MNGKHTIKQEKWYDYPVLKKGYNTPFKYKKKGVEINVMVGGQDGIAVLGVIYRINGNSVGCGGGSCLPGRKWGEFESLKDAELFGINYVLEIFNTTETQYQNLSIRLKPAIESLTKRKLELNQGVQMQLPF